jgi:hypothetical protein
MPAVPVFLLFLARSRKQSINHAVNRIVLVLFLFTTIYLAFMNIPFLNNILNDRILETSKGKMENRTMSTRWIAVQAFVKFFPDQPVLGAGNTKYAPGSKGLWNYKLESFLAGRSSQIHVGYFDLFYLYGLVGGIIFFLFFYFALRRIFIKSKLYNFRAAFWGLMALPIANIGLVSFNLMSAGLLLAFVLFNNLEVFCTSD